MTQGNHTAAGSVPVGAAQDDPAATLAALEGEATRVETPCGDGVMVWRIWGEGDPLLLVHGSSGSWAHWIRNIPHLARNRRVIVPDLPGHGASAKPDAETHEAIAPVLAQGLEQVLGAAHPLDMVGFSFGGVVAAHVAARYPHFARRLVIVDAGGLDTPLGDLDLRSPRGLEGEVRLAVLRWNLQQIMLHNPERVDAMALHMQQVDGRATRFRDPPPMVLPDRLLEVLPKLGIPIDAIWGEFDRPHPAPAVQEAVLRRFQPDMDFRVIADAGHWVMYEKPDLINAALGEMLAAPLRPV